jgi:hypothetical protein
VRHPAPLRAGQEGEDRRKEEDGNAKEEQTGKPSDKNRRRKSTKNIHGFQPDQFNGLSERR